MDGKVVTHFGVYDLTVRVGSARVAAAGVNLVVTHPDYRKQGLMPKTIWSSIEAMRDRGYDISIVANAVENYYERFGWRAAWPETHYYIAPESLPNEKPSVRLRKWNTRSRPSGRPLQRRKQRANRHCSPSHLPAHQRTRRTNRLPHAG